MALARLNLTIQDEDGNVVDGAEVTVRREDSGALAVPYSDREGTTGLGNPYVAADGAAAGFYVIGGCYRIDAELGAFTRTWRHEGVGTASEFDAEIFINAYRAVTRVATTANITIATALNNGDTLDGVVLATNDRVLVKDQTVKADNGIYVVGAVPARAADFDTFDEHAGAIIAVSSGTVNESKLFFTAVNAGGTLGVTDIVFSEIVGAPGAPGSALISATSVTSLAISAASKVFTITETDARGFDVGARLRASSDAAPAVDWMEGVVTAYAHPTLTVLMDKVGGSGTHTDWTINLAGEPGAAGALSGTLGSVDNVVPRADGTGTATLQPGTFTNDDTGNVFPNTTDVGALGTATKMWADVFLASGAVINFNNGDVIFTHSADTLTLSGATALSIGTAAAFTAGSIEVGHASDSSITRVSAGLLAVESSNILLANVLDIDGTLAANSDAKIATQKAVKTYADALIAANDAMVFKGVIDASANPNYPASNRGDTYRISVAGKIGGASGPNVEVGDMIIALTDGTAAGTHAAVGAQWSIIQANLDGGVIGPASATDNALAAFDGATGKLIKNTIVKLVTTVFSPTTDDGVALGSGTLNWSDLFLATGAVVNFGNGDVLLTHSANLLAFSGATSGYSVDGKFFPAVDDGAALGDTTHNFSDLFLALGSVINWNAGDLTLTHSANLLTLAGGDVSFGTTAVFTTGTIELGHASANTISASSGILSIEGVAIPTISSTHTMTNKRRTRRLTTTAAPGATPTTNTDNVDIMNFTGLAAAITSMSTNLTGTPIDGDQVEFRFTDNGTGRAIAWGASFASSGNITLPNTTVANVMLRVGFEHNGTVWVCVGFA